MSRNNYLIKDYEHKVNGRILCVEHGLLRCSECAHMDYLEKQNKRYQEAFKKIIKACEDGHLFNLYSTVHDIATKELEGEE